MLYVLHHKLCDVIFGCSNFDNFNKIKSLFISYLVLCAHLCRLKQLMDKCQVGRLVNLCETSVEDG